MNQSLLKIIISTILSVLVIASSTPVRADVERYIKTGYIQNESGKKCRYTQRTDKNSKHFYGIKHSIGIITFSDPNCMSSEELGDLGIGMNKMMINNVISKWYSHSDANFMTKESELFNGSMMQKKGRCIYSKKYPKVIGIAVDYTIKNKSIISLMHGASLMGCTK